MRSTVTESESNACRCDSTACAVFFFFINNVNNKHFKKSQTFIQTWYYNYRMDSGAGIRKFGFKPDFVLTLSPPLSVWTQVSWLQSVLSALGGANTHCGEEDLTSTCLRNAGLAQIKLFSWSQSPQTFTGVGHTVNLQEDPTICWVAIYLPKEKFFSAPSILYFLSG